jgi:hypothetical protein
VKRRWAARIRTYRQGLGDCFLVSLPRAAGEPFHVLIDCGVVLGTPDAVKTMTNVARDIAAATAGRLDVVVVSQAHWDHVSGFLQARGVFAEMTIGEVWLPGTEDPADARTAPLHRQREQALRGLRTLAGRLRETDAEAARKLRGPLGRFGPSSSGADDAIATLVDHPSRPRVRYQYPAPAPVDLPGTAARVFGLGPPRAAAPCPAEAGVPLFAAAGVPLDERTIERSNAFDTRYRIPVDQAQLHPFFQQHYFGSADAWRGIDHDWLATSASLALAADHRVNSTSLALALELHAGGPVLLFPGDTPPAAWSGWDACRWRRDPPLAPRVTPADLLARTVFLKVPHHGSQGGPPHAANLQRLTSPDLVAVITTEPPGPAAATDWLMPLPALVEQLRRQTSGRLLLTGAPPPDRPDGTPPGAWDAFTRHVEPAANGLYYDVTVDAG